MNKTEHNQNTDCTHCHQIAQKVTSLCAFCSQTCTLCNICNIWVRLYLLSLFMFFIFYQLGSIFFLIWCHVFFYFARQNKKKGYSSFSLHFIKVIHKRQVEQKSGHIQSNQGRIKLELYICQDLPYRAVIHCFVIYVVVCLFVCFLTPPEQSECARTLVDRRTFILCHEPPEKWTDRRWHVVTAVNIWTD